LMATGADESCADYLSDSAAQEALLRGEVKKGTLYSLRFPSSGVVVTENGEEIQISGFAHFNRAYHLDVVLVRPCQSDDHSDSSRSGEIVFIVRKQPTKKLLGTVQGKNITPLNTHYPRLRLPNNIDPKDLRDKMLLVSTEESWSKRSLYPYCRIIQELGPLDDFERQYTAIKHKYEIEEAFDAQQLWQTPSPNWKIPQDEIDKRRDLRNQQIFSIDPKYAKDLDDCLSCTKTESGNFLVGIHIADASYFVPYGSPLDLEARKRSTTFYFPNEKFPMLPLILSDNLCSLLENEDRLAVSIEVEITHHGEIVKTDFFRSVIRSQKHLDYETAQKLIENKMESLDYSVQALGDTVRMLYRVSTILRNKRFAEGALSMPSSRIRVKCDENNLITIHPEVSLDSNVMIEEYMLLANTLTANKLVQSIGRGVLVRSRKSPSHKKLATFMEQCKLVDIEIDITNNATIQNSLEALHQDMKDELTENAVANVASRAFNSATFECTDERTTIDSKEYHHCDLNVRFYGQFTSPIRRYSDLITHRQLIDVMEKKKQSITLQDMKHIARLCNWQRKQANAASRDADRLYMATLLNSTKKPQVEGIVVEVTSKKVKLLVPEYDQNKFVSFGRNCKTEWHSDDESFHFREPNSDRWLAVKLFTKVTVEIVPRLHNSLWGLDLCVLYPPRANQDLLVKQRETTTRETIREPKKSGKRK